MRKVFVALFCAAASASVLAINCPAMPQQSTRDYSVEAEAAAARVGPVRGPSVIVAAKSQATEVLSRYPNADRLYVMQMMAATYCSGLEADKGLIERDKAAQFQAFSKGVMAALYSNQNNNQPTAGPRTPTPAAGNGKASKEPKPRPPTQGTGVSAPVKETAAPVYAWLDKPVSITLRYAITPVNTRGTTTFPISWRDLFGILSPYLLAEPDEDSLRASVTKVLAEKYVTSPEGSTTLNHEIAEDDWQGIRVQFRTADLAKIENSETTDGSSAVFWGETRAGLALMRQIRAR